MSPNPRVSRLPALGPALGAVLGAATLAIGAHGPAAAQDVEDNWPGVSLGLTYETRPLPTLAVQPFSSAPQATSQASQAENIIARDLQYSDRFTVLDALPAALVRDEVDYSLWDQIRVTWLVTGRLEGEGASATLVVELHDVVYREVAQRGRFPVPSADSPEFRLAAHVVSDAIVEWAFGEPGIAATRIAFSRRMDDGSQDLWVVDSDGENLRRLTRHQAAELGHSITMSPAWSPDGRRLAFVSYKDAGMPRIYELNLDTGAEKMIPTPRAGDYITPTYHPGGELLYFGINGGNLNGIYSYNVVRDCCLTSVIEGRSEDLSPSFSPDGARFAFNSNRLGVAAPQIYVGQPNGASRPELLSPYEYDRPGYYTSPDWAPIGDRIAYHGRVERRGEHQVLVAEVDARGRPVRHVRHTFEGVNEDPSWAPDGRHLVYVGVRSWGHALFITDVVTGNTRTIVSGIRPNNPAWSPPLAPR